MPLQILRNNTEEQTGSSGSRTSSQPLHQQERTHNTPTQQDQIYLQHVQRSAARRVEHRRYFLERREHRYERPRAENTFYDRFPFLEADYSEERAVEISNKALEQHIQDYSDECFGSFVMKVIESKDHTTLVEVHSYFGFVVTGWTKFGTPGHHS